MSKAKAAPVPLPKSLIEALPDAAKIVQHSAALANLMPTLDAQLNKIRKRGAVPMARAYVVLHRAVERLEADLKIVNELYERYKTKVVPETFEHDGVTSIPLAEGFRVGASSTLRASIKKDMKEDAYAHLISIGQGDIITSTVNASTLSATAKELLEEKNIELPEKLFNVAYMPNTSVTQTK